MWRAANGHDALFEDCVGPSCYAKSQGTVVRIWGLLVAGVLFVQVLKPKEVMNTERYDWLVSNIFPLWLEGAVRGCGSRRAKVYLVQDHEKCLWSEDARAAMEDENIELLDFPKCSQDLNPIEVAWREVKARLNETMPTHFETRQQFIRRMRLAVAWVNKNRASYLKAICTSQKEWARDCLRASPPGGRTKH